MQFGYINFYAYYNVLFVSIAICIYFKKSLRILGIYQQNNCEINNYQQEMIFGNYN